MLQFSNVELALAALIVEAAIGYPVFVYRVIAHPVTWMGRLIAGLELRLNHPVRTGIRGRLRGVLAMIILLLTTSGAAAGLNEIASTGWIGAVLLVLASSSLLAQNSLRDHVLAVADALERHGLAG